MLREELGNQRFLGLELAQTANEVRCSETRSGDDKRMRVAFLGRSIRKLLPFLLAARLGESFKKVGEFIFRPGLLPACGVEKRLL